MLATTLAGRHLSSVIISTNCNKDDRTVVFQLSQVIAEMEGLFSKGKVCLDPLDSTNCLGLQPGGSS